MDQFLVDLGPHTTAVPGDEVVLVGDGSDGPTAQDQAEAAGTISWEIVTRVPARLGRVVVGAGPADTGPGADTGRPGGGAAR